jgi:hypothetical protein
MTPGAVDLKIVRDRLLLVGQSLDDLENIAVALRAAAARLADPED